MSVNRFSGISRATISQAAQKTSTQSQGPQSSSFGSSYYSDGQVGAGAVGRAFTNFWNSTIGGFFRRNTDNVEIARQQIDRGDAANELIVKDSATAVSEKERALQELEELKGKIAEKDRLAGMAADGGDMGMVQRLLVEKQKLELKLPKLEAAYKRAEAEATSTIETNDVAAEEIQDEARELSHAIGSAESGKRKEEVGAAIRGMRSEGTKLAREDLVRQGRQGKAELDLTLRDQKAKANVEHQFAEAMGPKLAADFMAKRAAAKAAEAK